MGILNFFKTDTESGLDRIKAVRKETKQAILSDVKKVQCIQTEQDKVTVELVKLLDELASKVQRLGFNAPSYTKEQWNKLIVSYDGRVVCFIVKLILNTPRCYMLTEYIMSHFFVSETDFDILCKHEWEAQKNEKTGGFMFDRNEALTSIVNAIIDNIATQEGIEDAKEEMRRKNLIK
jgi:hypothetical protein